MGNMGDHQTPVRIESALYLIMVATSIKRRIDERLAAEVGFPLADNEALANLRDAGGPLKMGEIAHRLTLSGGGVTKLVDRLEASGYVERTPDPQDRRVTTVEITDRGLAILEKSRPVIRETIREMWGRHISEDDAAKVLAVLKDVKTANWC